MFRRSPKKSPKKEYDALNQKYIQQTNDYDKLKKQFESLNEKYALMEQEKVNSHKEVKMVERRESEMRRKMKDEAEAIQATSQRRESEIKRLTEELQRFQEKESKIDNIQVLTEQYEAEFKALKNELEENRKMLEESEQKHQIEVDEIKTKYLNTISQNDSLREQINHFHANESDNIVVQLTNQVNDYEAKLMEQVEKNYNIAQRVEEEKIKRTEVEHTLKRTREQMKMATQRAVDVSRLLDNEKKNGRKLEIEIERSKENRYVYRRPGTSGRDDEDNYDDDHDQLIDDDNDNYNMDQFENDNEEEEEEEEDERSENDRNVVSRKKSKKKGKKKFSSSNKKRSHGRSKSASNLKGREKNNYNPVEKTLRNKIKKTQSKNVVMFRRLADAKRAKEAAESRDRAKSEQLNALSNHLEKMMSLLRAEAAAKASAQEAVRDIEDQLAQEKLKLVKILEEHAEEEKARKDEARRESMLAKQLELMDEKFNGLMRTHNFLRSKTEKESKKLQSALHEVGDKLYHQTKRNDVMNAAKRNVYNNLLRIITSAHLFDKLPFPSEMADKNTGQLKDNSPRHIVLDLQDCLLENEGAIAFVNAFNKYTINQAKKVVEKTQLLKDHSRSLGSGKGMDFTRPLNKVINVLPITKSSVKFSINLSYNGITDSNNAAVVRQICRSIVASNSIVEIDLKGNHIGRTGLRMILDALQYNPTIKAVDLSGNNVTDAHLTEYLNDNGRQADKMPVLTMEESNEALQLRNALSRESPSSNYGNNNNDNHHTTTSFGNTYNGSRNPYDIKKRPSSAPPGKGREVQMPFRKTLNKTTKQQNENSNNNNNNKPAAQKIYGLQFQPKMSAVSAVQRVITDSVTKVVAKNPFRKPETADDELIELSEIPEVGNNKKKKSTSFKKSHSTKKIRPKTAGGIQKSATTKNLRSRMRLPPKRPISADTKRRMGLKPGEKERKEALRRKKKQEAEEKRKREEMPEVTEVEDGSKPKYGGEYAKEIFWPGFARARAGRYNSMMEMLKLGMPIDSREPGSGDSMLMCAVLSGNVMVVKTLLRRGAKVNARNNKGWTALHCAVGADNPQAEMTNVLMDGGIQIEARDAAGVTALQLAVEQASDDIICRLVEAGANMKTQDSYGRSVMHRVAAVGDKETTELILNLGAKKMINVPDVDGRCPASYAERHDQFEFLTYLQTMGAIMEC